MVGPNGSTPLQTVNYLSSISTEMPAYFNQNTVNGVRAFAFCNDGCSWTAVFVLSTVLSVLMIAVNAVVIVVIQRTVELRQTAFSALVVNLCVSNIISSIVNGALSNCSVQLLFVYIPAACAVTDILFNTCIFVALTTIAAMSFDRFLAVAYHMRYVVMVTPVKYIVFMVVQWVLCAFISTMPLFYVRLEWCIRRFGGCSYKDSGFVIYVFLGAIYLPSAIILLFSYGRIWVIIRRLTRTAEPGAAGLAARRRRLRGVRTTIVILSSYIICTLPRAVVAFAMYTVAKTSRGGSDAIDATEDSTSLLLRCNALASPIVYCLTNRSVKDYIIKLVGKKLKEEAGSRKSSIEPVESDGARAHATALSTQRRAEDNNGQLAGVERLQMNASNTGV